MAKKKSTAKKSSPKPTCGIVMPISEIDNCSAEHWQDVLEILSDAIEQAGFTPNLVSNADESGVIQSRIVQNLYQNEIIVCDASGKNPNVMFELGMRLAFDKPAVVVKDHETNFSFDTSPIEHLLYPRSLHFQQIVTFKADLTKKLKATYEASQEPEYTTFLKHFGTYESSSLESETLPQGDLIIRKLAEMQNEIRQVRSIANVGSGISALLEQANVPNTVCVKGDGQKLKGFGELLMKEFGLQSTTQRQVAVGHAHITTKPSLKNRESEVREFAKKHGLNVNYVN